MNITQFTMEEVRCFAERQEFNIRPLTFLVGENSTGKTTALGCFQVLANYLGGEGINFNSDPYSMGTFKDIVRKSRKTEKAFKLGFTFRSKNEDVECTVEFVEGIEPIIRSVTVKFIDGEIVLRATNNLEESYIRLASYDEEQNQYHLDADSLYLEYAYFLVLFDRFTHREEKRRYLSELFKSKRETYRNSMAVDQGRHIRT